MPAAAPGWLAALEPRAPDVVAVWRLIETDFGAARRQLRHRAGPGSAERVLAQQEAVADALAAAIAGHEAESCPLDHPLVGRLRCGEWLLFAGVHDLMHVEQLHRLHRATGTPGTVDAAR